MIRITLFVSAVFLFGGLTAPLLAQTAPYNPYAPQADEPPPIAEDGTLHWPVFYKSAKMQLSYERLWNLGACRGTNKAITIPVEKNRVSIDDMPEGTISGQVTLVSTGTVMVKSADGKMSKLVTHPQGVSRVSVTGDVPVAMLKPGMIIRFTGKVDEHGVGTEPIEAIDVISLDKKYSPTEVKPGLYQTITAKVISLRGQHLQVLTGAGSVRRLSLQINEQAMAHVMTRDIEYASIGDTLTAKGHMYSGEGEEHWVFASDVTVMKETPVIATSDKKPEAPTVKKIVLKPLK